MIIRSSRAFTLVELLAVIVILAIILAIAIPGISNIINNVKVNAFIKNEQLIIRAAKNYAAANSNILPTNVGETTQVKFSDLQDNNYLSDIKDPNNNSVTCNGYVLITKTSGTTYEYTPFLKCGSSNTIDDYVDDGLQAYWKLDVDAYDYSPNNKHGTIHNVTSIPNRFNSPDKALSFDGGTSYVSVPRMNFPQMSIAAWINRQVKDLTNADAVFGGWYYNADIQQQQGYDLRFYINTDNVEFETVTQNSGGTRDHRTCSYDLGTNSTNQWIYVVGTYDQASGSQKLYINGELVKTVSYAANNTIVPLSIYADMRIGYSHVNVGYFKGYIDDVSIYSRPLTADEVKNNYDIEKNRSR